VFPFGLVIIGLRFLLRGLLVLSGHATTEEESEEWNENAPRQGEEQVLD
jgi:hypothetical protein